MSEEPSTASRPGAAEPRAAEVLGEGLAELIEDPEAFVSALRSGLTRLHDPGSARSVEGMAPGSEAAMAVRAPLLAALQRPLRGALAEASAASALWLAQRLAREEARTVRLFAVPCAARSLPDDPERTWQLLRQLGRGAVDWIEVDALAEPWARGILAEPFRWAELEQLVYSDHVMERRQVGSTLARLPRQVPTERRDRLAPAMGAQTFALLGQLIGDAEPMVQMALSWAIREWGCVAPGAATAFLRDQAVIALERQDGHRARVVLDSLSQLPGALSDELRRRLEDIRRAPDAPSTSAAAERAATFAAALPRADAAVGRQGRRCTRSRA